MAQEHVEHQTDIRSIPPDTLILDHPAKIGCEVLIA